MRNHSDTGPTPDTPEAAELGDEQLDNVVGGYKLERAFVKSWSTSGDADDRPTEEVAFYYNKRGG